MKGVVATASASRAFNRGGLPGTSEVPSESAGCIQATDDRCQGVT